MVFPYSPLIHRWKRPDGRGVARFSSYGYIPVPKLNVVGSIPITRSILPSENARNSFLCSAQKPIEILREFAPGWQTTFSYRR